MVCCFKELEINLGLFTDFINWGFLLFPPYFLVLRVILLFVRDSHFAYQIVIVKLQLFLNLKLGKTFCFPTPLLHFLHSIITVVHTFLYVQEHI